MRCFCSSLVLLLIAVGGAGQDKLEPLSTAEEAARVVAAMKAKDAGALAALAERPNPDPWLVADLLCAQGEHEAATAFAKAAPHADIAKLPAYVESRRGKGDNPATRKALVAVNKALGARDGRGVLRALAGVDLTANDVVSIRLLHGRGFALRWLRRLKESSDTFMAAGTRAESVGWLRRAAAATHESGMSAVRRFDWTSALVAWERCLAIWESRRIDRGIVVAVRNVGLVHQKRGLYAKAIDFQERALGLNRKLGDREGEARSLGTIGYLHSRLGAHGRALDCLEQALALLEQLGVRAGVAASLNSIGVLHGKLGSSAIALEYLQRSRALHVELKDRAGEAAVLANIGNIHRGLGDYARSLDYQEQALARSRATNKRAVMATVWGNIGNIHLRRGAYAKALACQERALRLRTALRDRDGIAAALGNIGIIHKALGDYGKALDFQTRCLEIEKALGNGAAVARSLANIGIIHEALGDQAKALAHLERARRLFDDQDNRSELAETLGNIGNIHLRLGAHEKALRCHEQALALMEEIGNRGAAAHVLAQVGHVHGRRGDHAKAIECYERSLAEGAAVGAAETEVISLAGLAAARVALGDPADGARAARRGVAKLPTLVGGLAEEQGATARSRWTRLLEHGVHAGLLLKDPAEVSFFLESGRAGTLLESLGNRDALGDASIPAELRSQRLAAHAAILEGQALLTRALASGKRREIRAARTALEDARAKMLELVERIQRAAKAAADVVYPKAASLADIASQLADGEALVLYALLSRHAVALVVTPTKARAVMLGKTAVIEAALQKVAVHDRDTDPAASLASLRRLVIAPLKLGPTTKRVLISPHGALSYLPFVLLAGEREVAYVPSGTTYALLRDERAKRGRDVLALGDPEYKTLARLPGTRNEAKAVGDVVLLGADAHEAALREKLRERERWRAVHLACHGLVDRERPLLSSLAVTRAGDDDGRLTTLEVFRMKIPADLVVLSACETARGKVYRAEGLVGFTRAFMFAGAPRVICSLWKVDDEATRALMAKFYELWSKHPTATALRKAQEFVRGQEKWNHPHYWAAWQLWGLAD